MTRRSQFIAGSAAGAALGFSRAGAQSFPSAVTVAYQPGLGYLPFIVLQSNRALGRRFPATEFTWRELGNGAVIRDGVVSNTIQIGAVGTAPFLVGWDRGVPWKILCDANNFDFWLVVTDPKIKSIKDLRPGDKIASPSPDAINAVVLRAALVRQGLPANYLDVGIVAMPHPIAEQALLAGQVVGHIATPPYAQDEVKRGGHVIMRTTDGFPGGITSTTVVAGTAFAEQYPALLDGYFKEYAAAVDFIQQHPVDAAKIYVAYTQGKADQTEIEGLLRNLSRTMYGIVPHGVIETARFLAKLGLIKKAPSSFAEISLGFVKAESG